MNILEIDIVSFSTRIAYTAAVELEGLMTAEDVSDVRRSHIAFLAVPAKTNGVERTVIEMGRYVCERDCETAERLVNHMREWSPEETHAPAWSDLEEDRRTVIGLFVDVCRQTHQRLKALQDAAEAAAAQAEKTAEPLKREDSIFEQEGSMGELDPARVEALEAAGKRDQAKQADEQKPATKKKAGGKRKSGPRTPKAMSAGKRKSAVKTPKPMSVGAAPAKSAC